MPQRSLDQYAPVQKKPVQEQVKAEALPMQTVYSGAMPKKRRVFPPVAPENLPPSYFVSATYDGRQRKAVVKLYEPRSGRLYLWNDNTGHKHYCLTNLS